MARTHQPVSHREDLIGIVLLIATLVAALLLARLVAGAVIGVGTLMTG